MTIANVALRQQSIFQKSKRCFADYLSTNSVVFMPHMHDEMRGDFRPLPEGVTQVEAGVHVSFQSTQAIENESLNWKEQGYAN